QLTRVAVFWNPDHPFHAKAVEILKAIAPSLSLELSFMGVRTPEQFGPAFSDVSLAKAQALYVVEDPIFFAHTNSNLVGCSTGKSAGLAPFRTERPPSVTAHPTSDHATIYRERGAFATLVRDRGWSAHTLRAAARRTFRHFAMQTRTGPVRPSGPA